MTEITYRGYRIERNATGMWEGRGYRTTLGPYGSVEVLQAAIDQAKGPRTNWRGDQMVPCWPPPENEAQMVANMSAEENPVTTALRNPLVLFVAMAFWGAVLGIGWLVCNALAR